MSSLLTLRRLGLQVAGRTLVADLSLDLCSGQRWAVLGPNGAGKTTLLHALAGLRAPQTGEIRWQDRPLSTLPARQRARHIGLLLQDDSQPFPSTVLETVLSGRFPHLGPFAWETAGDLALARGALHSVGLVDWERRAVDTLSGGERRRLAIATLLAQDPQVALLDEPTNHLDLHHQERLLGQLAGRFGAPDRLLVAVLHDPNLALRHCDHALLVFNGGNWLAGTATQVLTAENLSCLYGHPLRRIADGGLDCFVPAGSSPD